MNIKDKFKYINTNTFIIAKNYFSFIKKTKKQKLLIKSHELN